MTSRATAAVEDGTLFANIKYATFNHATFTELLSVVAAKAADMQSTCVGMDTVQQYLDEAADAMENVYAADSGERALALVYSRTEDDHREQAS